MDLAQKPAVEYARAARVSDDQAETVVHIERVVIKNYRCLGTSDVVLNRDLNIFVGENECGKSTLLEAIHLALSGQLNGRSIVTEVHPHLFNAEAVASYLAARVAKQTPLPPSIAIEVYFADEPGLAKFKGTNNLKNLDAPGISLTIELHEDFAEQFADYFRDFDETSSIRSLPIEYYVVRWRNFAGNDVNARGIPFKPSFIDASTMRSGAITNRYVVDILKDSLDSRQLVDLALSYRLMKDRFLDETKVTEINAALDKKKGDISNKRLSVSLDTSSRATWETGIMPHLDDIPLPLIGKGEQNSVKIKLALESSGSSHLVMIEEAENHLSFANLNRLIGDIADKRGDRQLIITTHSSFVLNKLGIDAVVMFAGGKAVRLNQLSKPTHDYFVKLPGHDTLRLILCQRAILVEGPSDELIVQRAFQSKHGKTPLEMGVDVITVNSLAFKRFLEIAKLLGRRVDVVRDNDGKSTAVMASYSEYAGVPGIGIQIADNDLYPTLEPQLVQRNGRALVNQIVGKDFGTDKELVDWMIANKTESALRFLDTPRSWAAPTYIERAIG